MEQKKRKGKERKGKESMSASALFERTVAHAYININYGALTLPHPIKNVLPMSM